MSCQGWDPVKLVKLNRTALSAEQIYPEIVLTTVTLAPKADVDSSLNTKILDCGEYLHSYPPNQIVHCMSLLAWLVCMLKL